MRPLRLAYLGNHEPSYSTESHIAASLESLGHLVTRLQEGELPFRDLPGEVTGHDLFIWTQTFGLAESGGTREERATAVARIRDLGVPSLGVHLDRWWGLEREWQVYEEPFFCLDTIATADGGHKDWWAEAGLNHVWFPPAVYHAEAEPGTPREEFRSPIAFVGSWQNYGHREWRHRTELVRHLRRRWRRHIEFWPKRGKGAVRGRDLQDLYASVDVAVGDSCLVPRKDGHPITYYASDRIPETVGRGCALVHPHVGGVTDGTLYEAGVHLETWPLNDWATLDARIERLLDDPEYRERIRHQGRAHVLEHHTYRVRMEQLLAHIIDGEEEPWPTS